MTVECKGEKRNITGAESRINQEKKSNVSLFEWEKQFYDSTIVVSKKEIVVFCECSDNVVKFA